MSLWSKFDLFKNMNSELILTKSAINQTQKIEVDTIYVGRLEDIECRQYHTLYNGFNIN